MKTIGLGIGNWLQSKEWKGKGQIQGIEIVDGGFDLKLKGFVHENREGKYFDLEPIPLTPDELMNLGFKKEVRQEKRGNGVDWTPSLPKTVYNAYSFEVAESVHFVVVFQEFHYAEGSETKIDQTTEVIYGNFYPSKIDFSDFIVCKSDFVHEIQNAVHALTGIELTYNLNQCK